MRRDELLDRYRAGYETLEASLADLREGELDRPAPDGGWTVRQVVHHLADSEATAFVRLRRLVAEDNPTIAGYDEPLFARRLHYDRPIGASLAVVAAVRASSLELLESLDPAEWDRGGTHTESGPYRVDDWLAIYAAHPGEHAEQIRALRAGGSIGA